MATGASRGAQISIPRWVADSRPLGSRWAVSRRTGRTYGRCQRDHGDGRDEQVGIPMLTSQAEPYYLANRTHDTQ